MSAFACMNTTYERELLARSAHCSDVVSCDELTVELLQQLAARQGIDCATAWLYKQVRQSPIHGPFIERLETQPRTFGSPPPLPATLVIVPGAFYVEFPHTGADGQLLREEAARFGCRSELVPLPSFGSLADNARILCEWLSARPEEPVLLASLSKGGADVKTALARPEAADAFRNVICWINLSGLLQGTPLVDWLFASTLRTWWFRLLFWLRGYNFRIIPELARGSNTPLSFELRLPPHLKAIHVVGFPLVPHLSNPLARRCFRRAQHLGPNDGAGIILADAARLPGLVYPVWGADHYLRPTGLDVREIARRIFQYLSDEWDRLVPCVICHSSLVTGPPMADLANDK
jgi:hypothetical protein